MNSKSMFMALALVAFSPSCTLMDPADAAKWNEKIEALPPPDHDRLVEAVLYSRLVRGLGKRPSNDRVGSIECLVGEAGSEKWQDANVSMTINDMLLCLSHGFSYAECGQEWGAVFGKAVRQSLARHARSMGVDVGDNDFNCRFKWDIRYEPQKVYKDFDQDLNSVSLDDLVHLVFESKTQPVPFPVAGPIALEQLLPILCALSASWGCPGDPTHPGGDM